MIQPDYSRDISRQQAVTAASLRAWIDSPDDYKLECLLRYRERHPSLVIPRELLSPSPPTFRPRSRRRRQRAARPPDGLRTLAEAAAKLRCSIKTLNGHVAAGALKYVIIGHGMKRPRRMFTDADLYEFVASQTRKDSPCLSDATRARRSGNTISKSEVIAFSALQRRRRGAKPKQ